MKWYFVLYNVVNVAGWSYVLFHTWCQNWTTIPRCSCGERLGWRWLTDLAAMEILRSLFGLVRSWWGLSFRSCHDCWSSGLHVPAEACHEHWSLYLMVLSWCFIEVVRYSFYAINLLVDNNILKVPYTLFWLRYNLFQVLYPTGITGELVQMYVAMPYILKTNPVGFRLALAHYGLYTVFSPFVMFNMFNMRNRATKKLNNAKKGPRPIRGVSWPITNNKGDRSTTVTNRAIWETSFNAWTQGCAKWRRWRTGGSATSSTSRKMCAWLARAKKMHWRLRRRAWQVDGAIRVCPVSDTRRWERT